MSKKSELEQEASNEPSMCDKVVSWCETQDKEKALKKCVSLPFERNPIHTSCSTKEMSRMKRGHPGNFLNLSYMLKVNEFTDFDNR